MTRVEILPVPDQEGQLLYHAVAGEWQSAGKTAGEALDALSLHLPGEDATWIIVQRRLPDEYFTAAQQERLTQLMDGWRRARDQGEALPQAEQAELERLVDAELAGSARRASSLANASTP